MAKKTHHHVTQTAIGLKTTIELDEAEVRALDGIFGYNVEDFLRVFYKQMGEAYVKPHEAGVRSLHATIRRELAEPLAAVARARRQLSEALSLHRDEVAKQKAASKPKVKVPAA